MWWQGKGVLLDLLPCFRRAKGGEGGGGGVIARILSTDATNAIWKRVPAVIRRATQP
jgi:hypothetical protein